MGLHIRTYSFDELNAVSLPGQAPSTLFWAIPLGSWEEQELGEYWRVFTEREGNCKELGLFLDNNEQRNYWLRDTQDTVNLDKAGKVVKGHLNDLIPRGAKHSITSHQNSTKGILVCSGSYPQPGWGVWLELERLEYKGNFIREFQRLIDKTLSDDFGGYESLLKVNEIFYEITKMESNIAKKKRELVPCEAIKEINKTAYSVASILTDDPFLDAPDNASIVLDFIYEVYIQEKGDFYQYSGYRELMISNHRDSKKVLRIHSALTEENLSGEDDCPQYATRDFNGARIRLGRQITLDEYKEDLFKRKELTIKWLNYVIQNLIHETNEALDIASKEIKIQHLSKCLVAHKKEYTCVVDTATHIIAKKGPEFLVNFESACRRSGLNCASIAWDPVRMIGWKLSLTRSVSERAFMNRINEILPANLHVGLTGRPFDGRMFVDYVQQCFIHKSAQAEHMRQRPDSRSIARYLLEKLTSDDDLITILEQNGIDPAGELANKVLDLWGWRDPQDNSYSKSLRSCLSEDVSDTLKFHPVEVRRRIESFCKDIIPIIAKRLGWRDCDIRNNINDWIPSFTLEDGINTWNDFISRLTIGEASILFNDLLPVAFPGKTAECQQLASMLKQAADILNRVVHDGDEHIADRDNQIAQYVSSIIKTADLIFGEMPWHFEPTQSFKGTPIILRGYAWSHSHPDERFISIAVHTYTRNMETMLIWNPTRTNPVMTDYKLL